VTEILPSLNRKFELMRSLVKKIAWRIIDSTPLSACQFLVKRKVIGLEYHVISDKSLQHIKHLFQYKSPAMFENDLIYLKKNHNLVSYEQLVNGQPIKNNSIIITFDDGYTELFSIVRPLLLKHKIPCIFFITTDFIDNKKMFYRNKVSLCIEKIISCSTANVAKILDEVNNFSAPVLLKNPEALINWIKSLNHTQKNLLDDICDILELDIDQYLINIRPYLTSEEIKILSTDGFTIGAHTKYHPELNLISDRDEIENQIAGSCKIISDLVNKQHIPFAFPFSSDGIDRNLIKSIVSTHDFIRLIFDANRLKKDIDIIINRINADSPVNNSDNKTNLRQLLLFEYHNHVRWYLSNLAIPF